jgi:hypothetical protein
MPMQRAGAVSATRTQADTYACTGVGTDAAAGASMDADADAEAGARGQVQMRPQFPRLPR